MNTKDYLELIRSARVYDVADVTPLDLARNLSDRLGNRVLMKRAAWKFLGESHGMADLEGGDDNIMLIPLTVPFHYEPGDLGLDQGRNPVLGVAADADRSGHQQTLA